MITSLKKLKLKWSRYCVLPLVVKGVPMDPDSENAFSEKKMTKLGTHQDYSKTIIYEYIYIMQETSL